MNGLKLYPDPGNVSCFQRRNPLYTVSAAVVSAYAAAARISSSAARVTMWPSTHASKQSHSWSACCAAVATDGGRRVAATAGASVSDACRRGPRQRIRRDRILRVPSRESDIEAECPRAVDPAPWFRELSCSRRWGPPLRGPFLPDWPARSGPSRAESLSFREIDLMTSSFAKLPII
jgi:hypothetical protein